MNQIPQNFPPRELQSPRKKSVASTIKEILNSDIVWYSTAAACVLGVVLFYFQGLQPLLLRYHINETFTQLTELQEQYVSQVTTVKDLSTLFSNATPYSPSDVCKNQVRYTTFPQDAEAVDRLSVTLLTQPRPTEYDSKVYLPEVEAEYNRVYTRYATIMESIRENAAGFKGVPAYLRYITTWTAVCEKIEESTGVVQDVRDACSSLTQAYESFSSATKPFFWDQFEERNTQALDVCNGIDTSQTTGNFRQFATFKINFLSSYDSLRSFVPDYVSYTAIFDEYSQELAMVYESVLQELNAILTARQSLGGLWYIVKLRKP